MDHLDRAQVLLLCDLCQRDALQSHCELCQINLCKACVGDHLSDSSIKHKVVPYKHRTSTLSFPICRNHTQKHCELYCEKCEIPVCSICIFSDKHHKHKIIDILQKSSFIKETLNKDSIELERRILPTYEEIAAELNFEKVNLEKHYEKLTTAVTNQGEDWHREIDIIVNKKKSEIDEMKSKHLAVLNKKGQEIEQILFDVKHSLFDLKKILNSNESFLSTAYKSRNAEFRSLPPKVNVKLPSFYPHQINTERANRKFGSLSALSITTEEHGYTMKTPDTVSCSPIKLLLDQPMVIITIHVSTRNMDSVTCRNDEEIWTYGYDKIMELYNLQEKLLKSIQTKSGNIPRGITVTGSGDLVYTDPGTRSVNIVKNEQIQEVIRLQGWRPFNVCSTSSGDLLVTMGSDDYKQSKVVRYSGSTEKQIIQFESKSKPLYSPYHLKYISENRNFDICVADCGVNAVVVVNQTGKLRFRYTGHPSSTNIPFKLADITTNSLSQILTADCNNHCIHILDQDGQFLRYIDNCDLHCPYGLCVDTRDNLFVAECDSGKVKKIKYVLSNV
ncbi:tripartite motif-containing protein 2-like [Saccostrea cucullata]|uniref:tripartite motif-containing protein 2-like n=1 Tax=Saccostrea cuccullata TaxID=36930 RepID=UPI002ED22504